MIDVHEWIPCVYTQVGNGCVGNEVGGCGHETGLKIHIDFYHGHALFQDVSCDEFIKFLITNILYMQALYDKIISTCDFEHSKPKQECM